MGGLGRWPTRVDPEHDPLLRQDLTTTCGLCGYEEKGVARVAISAMRDHRADKHPEIKETDKRKQRRRRVAG